MTDKHDDTFDLDDADLLESESGRNSSVDPKLLTAAMMTPDMDVEMPGRGQPGSMVSNLIALKVDECYTKSVEVTEGSTMAQLRASLNEWKNTLRQSVNQAIRHAKNYDGRTLSLETSQTITPSGRVFVQVIVTRTA